MRQKSGRSLPSVISEIYVFNSIYNKPSCISARGRVVKLFLE